MDVANSGENRSLSAGVPGWGSSISLRAPFGLAFALLQHDFVERFLLHFYAVSAHGYTRGSWTTPQSSNLADRDEVRRQLVHAADLTEICLCEVCSCLVADKLRRNGPL